jgi:hypothetical protein
MDMKLESRIGNRCVYSTFIDGHLKRATTIRGEEGARRIFEIIKAQNGVSISPTTRIGDYWETPPRR